LIRVPARRSAAYSAEAALATKAGSARKRETGSRFFFYPVFPDYVLPHYAIEFMK
jgi:hypothetical protein